MTTNETVHDVDAGEDIANETVETEPAETATAETEIEIEPDDKPGREAAKYRRQLREVETERDALRGTVEAMQRAEAERLAAQGVEVAMSAQAGPLAGRVLRTYTAPGIKPAALWASGVQVADLLTEAGTVDPDKVAAAVKTARDVLGLAYPSAPTAYAAGKNGSVPGGEPSSLEQAFAPRRD